MKRAQTILLRTTIVAVVVVVLHLVLLYSMSQGKIASTLFAAGPHVPLSSLMLAMAFLVARLAAIVVLPGYVLYRLVKVCCLRPVRGAGPEPLPGPRNRT